MENIKKNNLFIYNKVNNFSKRIYNKGEIFYSSNFSFLSYLDYINFYN